VTCGFCIQEKRAPPNSCGLCQFPQCGRAVCTSQCANNQRPHADWCGCTCGLLICDFHRPAHLLLQHPAQQIGGCFPITTASMSASTIVDASDALGHPTGAGVDAKMASRLTRFLNVVTPGHDALVERAHGFQTNDYSLDDAYWPASDAEPTPPSAVVFAPTFFTAGTLERVLILASAQLGHAVRATEIVGFTPSERGVVDAFRTRTSDDVPWVPPKASPAFRRELQFILTIPPPDTADAIAQWLTETRSVRELPATMT
jgi:hypothetical protein